MTRQQRACLGSVGGVRCAALLPSGEWLKELISNLRPGRWLGGGGVSSSPLLAAALRALSVSVCLMCSASLHAASCSRSARLEVLWLRTRAGETGICSVRTVFFFFVTCILSGRFQCC